MKRTMMIAAIAMLISSTAFAEEVKVTVQGMVCAFCAQGIEHALKEQQSVSHVKIDLDNGLVTIHEHDQQTITDKTITDIVTDAGFTVEKIERI